MTRLRAFLTRVLATFQDRSDEDGLVEEIETHLQLLADDYVRRGLPPDEAMLAARRTFGGVVQAREACRDQQRLPSLDAFSQDVRHALRRLRAKPAIALAAVALLALAVGLTSAMFTLFDSLILRPAPFRDPASLARLAIAESEADFNVNLPLSLIREWRRIPAFVAVHAVAQQQGTFGTGEHAYTVSGARVTPGLIEELGVMPLLGRTFVEGEGRPGHEDVAIVSEGLWRSRFGADPAVLERRVQLSGGSVLIVGVMPATFAFPFSQTSVWRPLDVDHPPARLARPNATAYAYARLAPGIPRLDAVRIATAAAHRVASTTAGKAAVIRPISEGSLDVYSAGTVKVGAVGVALVFVVLCANVATLMLVRLGARRREFALCSAMGASQGRLLRQALCEQLLVGAAAAVLGLAAGGALVRMARTFLPDEILGRTLNPVDLDIRAVMATGAVSVLAVLIAGVLPAWLGTRGDVSPELQLSSRAATPDRKVRRMTSALLVAELAFAVALCVAAGIQLRSFLHLLYEERGIDADRLATFEISLPAAQFGDAAGRYAVAEALRSSVEGLPGVEAAALSFGVPPASGSLYFYDVVPDVPDAAPVKLVMNSYHVAPGFFQVYGIHLVEGRAFQPRDSADAVIVSESMAAALWPESSAVGRTMRFDNRTFRVLGVSREIRNPLLDPRSDEPEVYELLTSSGATTANNVTARCTIGCPPLEAIRARMRSASPGATIGPGCHVRDAYARGLERPRAGAAISIAFAFVALIAVGVGLFAVLTRVAAHRRHEFGIRLALGATPADIRRLVHFSSLWISAAGIGAGAALAWMLARLMAAVQYQVHVSDPLTWIVVTVSIGATTLLAAWRPAQHAMRVDPIELLRDE